jgi:hypothetical protein
MADSFKKGRSLIPDSITSPARWPQMYEKFVSENASSVSQIESALRSLTYIIPGRHIRCSCVFLCGSLLDLQVGSANPRSRLNHVGLRAFDSLIRQLTFTQSTPASNCYPSIMTRYLPEPSPAYRPPFPVLFLPFITGIPNFGQPNRRSTRTSPSCYRRYSTPSFSGKWQQSGKARRCDGGL